MCDGGGSGFGVIIMITIIFFCRRWRRRRLDDDIGLVIVVFLWRGRRWGSRGFDDDVSGARELACQALLHFGGGCDGCSKCSDRRLALGCREGLCLCMNRNGFTVGNTCLLAARSNSGGLVAQVLQVTVHARSRRAFQAVSDKTMFFKFEVQRLAIVTATA